MGRSLSSSSSAALVPTAAAVALGSAAVALMLWRYHNNQKSSSSPETDDEQHTDLVILEDQGRPHHEEIALEPVYINGTSSSFPIREVGINDKNSSNTDQSSRSVPKQRILSKHHGFGMITIVHGSVTGTCARLAQQLQEHMVQKLGISAHRVQVGSIPEWDWWDEFLNEEEGENDPEEDEYIPTHRLTTAKPESSSSAPPRPLLMVLLPTYTGGTWSPPARSLETALQDLQQDWRVAKFPLKKKLHVAVFGMGSSECYEEEENPAKQRPARRYNMGRPAKEAVRHFQKLGAKCLGRVAVGDDAVGQQAQDTFSQWLEDLSSRHLIQYRDYDDPPNKPKVPGSRSLSSVVAAASGQEDAPTVTPSSCACASGKETSSSLSNGTCCQSSGHASSSRPHDDLQNSNLHGHDEEEEDEDDEQDDDEEEEGEPEVIDLEDMGDAVLASERSLLAQNEPREMVTPSQAAALKKEGYKLIGSHSAVKLCRWTKHQLRGRGGCYKHSFYGITSYQCMEATPSLACANKCVFCWRHHKNPVGKEWRWKTDDPAFIVEQAIELHTQMIKEAKGIPGVRMDRWQEAHVVRHCALSLVGEPIMYPRINEMLGHLHQRKISSFLVTNGQHPAAIASLRPVTQLYVSVDAPTQESLIAIDRPLFNDAWDRLKLSLSSLKDKGQRTVARLTVVKGWNSDEIEGYAQLVALGEVSLVEVKGVTFCGKSDASNLNMSNIPWHHEVVELTQALKLELDKLRLERGSGALIPEYDLACEHKHSCSVLLARVDQFSETDPVTGQRKWKTWIDYDRFQALAARHDQDPIFSFSVQDYTAPTPSWAIFGSEEEGFDPTDKRFRKHNKHPKYTQFDDLGVPTHDHNNHVIPDGERQRLLALMETRIKELGCGSSVTERGDGAIEVVDVRNMFRGMVVSR